MRVDVFLVEYGHAQSREAAKKSIDAALVKIDGRTVTKAGEKIDETLPHEVEFMPLIPYVSRGGLKLEAALKAFDVDPTGMRAVDIGASTGGFTDCLLQHGAAKVMAVDVGTNQLAYKLRTDPRVWVRENYNARYMKAEDLPDVPSVAVTDVSFISLKLILPPIVDVLAPGGEIVALIKPQFEVGKGNAPGGLVRDEKLRIEACNGIVRFAREELSLQLLGLEESPILGKEMGNIEYLSYWRKAEMN